MASLAIREGRSWARLPRFCARYEQRAKRPNRAQHPGARRAGQRKGVAGQLYPFRVSRGEPYVVVDSGALNPSLYASELFGHRRGSFTGADSARVGKIVLADGGDLFLDEIGNMPRDVQAGLLRVLEQREVMPLGASAGLKVDVRFLSATNEDLESRQAEEPFVTICSIVSGMEERSCCRHCVNAAEYSAAGAEIPRRCGFQASAGAVAHVGALCVGGVAKP